jgi:hypothetical protein
VNYFRSLQPFQMRKIVKYFLRTLIGILVFLIFIAGVLFCIGYFYGDEAKQLIVAEINKSLTVKISVKKIDLTLFKNFPEAAIEFSDIKSEEKSGSPLIKAKTLSLLFDVYDILLGDYTIEKMIISEASVNLMVFEDKRDNFSIHKTTNEGKQGSVEINLQKVILVNVIVSYINVPSDQEYLFTIHEGFCKGAFSSEKYLLDFKGKINSNYIRSGKTKYLEDRTLNPDLTVWVDNKENIFTIKKGQLEIDGILLNLSGIIKSQLSNKFLNLEIHSDNSSLKTFINLLPEDFTRGIKSYEPDGKLSFGGKITGDFTGDITPQIQFQFELEQGEFKYNKPSVSVKNVSFKGAFDNGELRSGASSRLYFSDFKAGLTAGNLTGELTIVNFEKPIVTASVNSEIKLERLGEIMNIENLQSISGSLKLDFQFTNTIRSLERFTLKDFISSRTSGAMKISGVNLQMKNNPVVYSGLDGSFKFNNKDLVVESFSGKIGSSDFRMKGYFLNILAFAFSPDESIRVKANFSSSYLNMDDLLSDKKDVTGTKYRLRFSDRINFDLDLDLRKFSFGTFQADNISGNVILKDKKLVVSNTTLNTMEGRTTLTGSVDGNFTDKFRISFTTGLSNVNIQKMFYQLGEFGQENITSEHLRGKVDATIYYKSFIDPELNIDASSVYALGDLTITEGELIRYTPLYKLAKYLKSRELEHIRFSTLKNQIEIKDQVVYIPDMDIESSTLNLKINGTHTFENIIDYHIGVLLSELMAKNEKKKEEEIDGIFPVDDGLGKTTLYLSMTGNVEDPDIRYDTKAVKKKISSDLKKEKVALKDILNKEFSGKEAVAGESDQQENSGITTLKEKNFKIEWDEAIKEDSVKSGFQKKSFDQNQKKSSKKEFIIEWDEENDSIKEPRN